MHRKQLAQSYVEEGQQHLLRADEFIKVLIDVCGLEEVVHAYRRDLSGVNTVDRLAEILCEIAVCAAASRISSTAPRLHPSSGRPGRQTHCDVSFEVAGIRIYGEVKRYPAPLFRESETFDARYSRRPIDLYSKLQEGKVAVPDQFPEGTVNLLFVYHTSLDPQETLQQALFGWGDAHLRPMILNAEPQKEDGLLAQVKWRDISGCCLCQVRSGSLYCPTIWENPQALVHIPPLVRSALNGEIV